MKIDEMKKVCEAATEGEWAIDKERRLSIYSDDCAFIAQTGTEEDLTFITTFNPNTVRKLLAVVVAATEMRRPVPPEITAAFAVQTWLDGLERALDNALAALEE